MRQPFLVFEDIARTPKRKLFHWLGVEWLATRFAWLSPVLFTGLGFCVAVATGQGPVLYNGLRYGILLYLTSWIHTLGHILGGSLAGSRMDANILTATRDVNVYRDPKNAVSRRVRVVRTLGGPVTNVLVGFALAISGSLASREWLRVFGYFNAAVGLWTLLPVPTLDGAIVWRPLLERLRAVRSGPR